MLFNIPMSYQVNGVLKGKRNQTEEWYWELVEIDIPVLSDETAPVAVVWDDSYPFDAEKNFGGKNSWCEIAHPPEDGEQMVRLVDGEYYYRRADRMTPTQMSGRFADLDNFPTHIFSQGIIPYKMRDKEYPVSEVTYREDKEFESNFNEKLAELRSKAEDFFILGDDIFVKGLEPVVAIKSVRTNDWSIDCPRIMPKSKLNEGEVSYSVDDYAEALEKCLETNNKILSSKFSRAGRGEVPVLSEVFKNRKLEVRLDSLPKSNLVAEAIVSASHKFVEDLSRWRENLDHVDPDYGIEVLKFRKALNKFGEDNDYPSLEDAAVQLVENFGRKNENSALKKAVDALHDQSISLEVGSLNGRKM